MQKKSQPSCFVQGREFLQNRRDFIARNRKHVHSCKRGNATRGFHTNCTLQTGKTFSKTSMDRNVHKDFSFEGMRILSRNPIVAIASVQKSTKLVLPTQNPQEKATKFHTHNTEAAKCTGPLIYLKENGGGGRGGGRKEGELISQSRPPTSSPSFCPD